MQNDDMKLWINIVNGNEPTAHKLVRISRPYRQIIKDGCLFPFRMIGLGLFVAALYIDGAKRSK